MRVPNASIVRRRLTTAALPVMLILGAGHATATAPVVGAAAPETRISLRFDTSEAEAVLAIVARERAGQGIPDSMWQTLFATRPYVRLQLREASMHRAFTDSTFIQFVSSAPLVARADSLRRTLDGWRRTDLAASARRVLAYLPDSARITASVYPVIKPRTNSFVFEPSTDAAIFLYLDPVETAAEFENTVAHEMHHIGFSSVSDSKEARLAGLAPRVRRAVDWLSAFGEGFAMLAAAGGPDVHPHAVSSPEVRARWDRDMTHFDADVDSLQAFFFAILDGRLATDEAASAKGFTFFGEQGPWYTVGYRMAATVERRFGRAQLIDCMIDPRRLLLLYDEAVAQSRRSGEVAATWSPELLRKLGVATRRTEPR